MTLARRYLRVRPRVLVVTQDGEDDPVVRALGEALDGVEVVATRDRDAPITERIWTVVLRAPRPGGSAADLVAELRDSNPDRPVVVVGDDRETTVAGAVTAAGGRFLPLADETAISDLVSAVETAVSDYERHWSDGLWRSAFEELFESYDEMLSLKDADGRYLAAAECSQWPDPAELLGTTDADLARDRDNEWNVLDQCHEDALRVAESGDRIFKDVRQYGEGEAAFWHERTVLPWTDEAGRTRGVIRLTRDVSDWERKKRSMRQRIDKLEQFTDFVSHDLRSPLQVASGYLDLARDGDEESLERVAAAIDRMQELIGDLENLARDGDSEIAQTRTTQLVDIVRDVWALVDTEDAALEIEMPEDTVISTAESELRPLFENLLRNAVEHGSTDSGEGLTVRVGALDDGFYVEDDGPGIPEADRAKVFEDGYTDGDGGTGTGLAIVRDIVESHNWTVGVEDGRVGGAKLSVRNCLMATDPDPTDRSGTVHELESDTDVGAIESDGSARYDETTGEWTVVGGGDDIWQHNNDFHFVYTGVEGPASIRARVVDIQEVDPFSKAGVIVRDSAADEATHGYLGRTPGHGAEVSWRSDPSEPTVSQQLEESGAGLNWLRIDRDGDTITAYLSRDGEQWNAVDQRAVPLEDPVCIGLAVCSVVPRALCTATFDDVEVRELDAETE